jgi:hypothetical protein
VRKDSVAVVRSCQSAVLDALLLRSDALGAVEIVKTFLRDILAHRPGDDLAPYVQSKELKSNYKCEESLPHVVVNSLLRARQPGSEMREGDRVRFVVVASACERVVDKVEAADYAAEHRLPIDWAHYAELLSSAALRLILSLRNTHAAAAKDLEAFVAAAKGTALAQVKCWSMSRTPNGWIRGIPTRSGGTQLQLAVVARPPAMPPSAPGNATSSAPSAPSAPAAKRRRLVEEEPPRPSYERLITSFFKGKAA